MKDDSAKLWQTIDHQIKSETVELGRYSSDDYINHPKHIAFITSRYKFCARMIEGLDTVIEVGCGDGIGAPIVAEAVKHLICTDINSPILEDVERRHKPFENINCTYFDFREKAYKPKVDAIFFIDVLEHIFPNEEMGFMSHIAESLCERGIALIGTPNITAERYACELSRKGHVNLKSHQELRDLGLRYFYNTFMFGMNDEVLHTGFPQMCHYLWALCVSPRSFADKM